MYENTTRKSQLPSFAITAALLGATNVCGKELIKDRIRTGVNTGKFVCACVATTTASDDDGGGGNATTDMGVNGIITTNEAG